ncbi:MAG: hypothetical protein BRD46_04290 [Bacteroidetes bacterium QS_8_68_15]|nr:MAG: hypothetical protein BRD46_04290 [Bacteroidetes bacterium QS_8_68_15]
MRLAAPKTLLALRHWRCAERYLASQRLFLGKCALTVNRLLQILLAIFLPPLSVFLQRGLGAQFALNCVLTLILQVPGAIHALWLLLSGRDGGYDRGGRR